MATINPLVITYNCGRELVNPTIFSQHIASEFPEASPELLVFALEEVAPLAYSFLAGSFLSAYLERIRRTVELASRSWGNHAYENVLTRNLGMTVLMVFARTDIKNSIARIEAGGAGVGYMEMGNKGAVAVRLSMRNGQGEIASLTFVAAHLAPMEEALERRNEDWKQIVQGVALSQVMAAKARTDASPSNGQPPSEEEPLLQDSQPGASASMTKGLYATSAYHDSTSNDEHESVASHLIVAGDLNYRTANHAPRPYSRAGFPRLSADEDSPHHHKRLLPSDQLKAELSSRHTLHGLTEAEITFAPTYKYSKKAQKAMAALEDVDLKAGSRRDESADTGLETNAPMDWPWADHRWPSWCDRILWLPSPSATDGDEISALKYTSLKLMSTSDHQPVALHLSIPFKPVKLSSNSPDIRLKPPFELDPNCNARRLAARRKELVVGAGAFMVTTTEGQAILLALVVGALGGWAIISSLLS